MADESFEAFSTDSGPDEPHALVFEALRKQGLPTEVCDKVQQACRD